MQDEYASLEYIHESLWRFGQESASLDYIYQNLWRHGYTSCGYETDDTVYYTQVFTHKNTQEAVRIRLEEPCPRMHHPRIGGLRTIATKLDVARFWVKVELASTLSCPRPVYGVDV